MGCVYQRIFKEKNDDYDFYNKCATSHAVTIVESRIIIFPSFFDL